MPQKYQEQISDFSLEEYYIELFEENDIPHIDFLSYFKDIFEREGLAGLLKSLGI